MHTPPSGPLAHAGQALDVLAPAKRAGWLNSISCRPGELLFGVALLSLGSQQIPIRVVVNDGDTGELLSRLHQELCTSLYLEQFVILVGFEGATLEVFRQQLAQHPTRKLHASTYEGYLDWVSRRLGPLSMLGDTALRTLLEPFLSYSNRPGPAARCPMVGSFKDSSIRFSFELGALGVQALTTLMTHVRGRHHVTNVELNPAWQKEDVDLLVRGLSGGEPGPLVKLEVKNENYLTGNISLEDISNTTKGSPGWLKYSTADVLASITWPTGDVIFSDMNKLREYVYAPSTKIPLKAGWAKGQTYKSAFYCTPIEQLLDELPACVCLNLADWLPETYGHEFVHATQVPAKHSGRMLRPQRH